VTNPFGLCSDEAIDLLDHAIARAENHRDLLVTPADLLHACINRYPRLFGALGIKPMDAWKRLRDENRSLWRRILADLLGPSNACIHPDLSRIVYNAAQEANGGEIQPEHLVRALLRFAGFSIPSASVVKPTQHVPASGVQEAASQVPEPVLTRYDVIDVS
jgi:hypothetical protein